MQAPGIKKNVFKPFKRGREDTELHPVYGQLLFLLTSWLARSYFLIESVCIGIIAPLSESFTAKLGSHTGRRGAEGTVQINCSLLLLLTG